MKTYWLTVYSDFIEADSDIRYKGDSDIRYCLWCCDTSDQSGSGDDIIFKCKSKCELRIFMNLTGLKVMRYDLIVRKSRIHNNKILKVYFPVVNILKDN